MSEINERPRCSLGYLVISIWISNWPRISWSSLAWKWTPAHPRHSTPQHPLAIPSISSAIHFSSCWVPPTPSISADWSVYLSLRNRFWTIFSWEIWVRIGHRICCCRDISWKSRLDFWFDVRIVGLWVVLEWSFRIVWDLGWRRVRVWRWGLHSLLFRCSLQGFCPWILIMITISLRHLKYLLIL